MPCNFEVNLITGLGVIYLAYLAQTWPPRLILFSDWLMLKKSSPLKQLGQMEPNLAGSIYVRSKPVIDGPWHMKFL
jgi:hypothetical protein